MVAASINFYVWRGRVRHSFKYPMLARFARRTGFFDAAYGPTQFFFGELFALRPHRRADATSASAAATTTNAGGRRPLARGARRLRLPALLPARDRRGLAPGRPDALRPAAVAGADDDGRDADVGSRRASSRSSSATPVDAVPRTTASRRSTATTTSATRSRTCACSAARGRTDPSACDLAVAASNRAGHVYRLASRGAAATRSPSACSQRPSVDVVAWREDGHAVALRDAGRELRFAPGRAAARRAAASAWTRRGRPSRRSSSRATARSSPRRIRTRSSGSGQILGCVNAGEVVASAAPGYEFRDAGGAEPPRRRLARVAARGRLARAAGCGRRRQDAAAAARASARSSDIAALCAGALRNRRRW